MNLKLITLALAVAVAGCVNSAELAPASPGATRTMEGTLHMKGSLPKTRAVLVPEGGGAEWELEKVPADIVSVLQNKKVRVTGTVTRATRMGMLGPSISVDKLDQVSK